MKIGVAGFVLMAAVVAPVFGADATTAPGTTKAAAVTKTDGVAAPLPAEVQARMVPLFDGKTLTGWETQPRMLGNGNLTAGFLEKLSTHADPMSAFLFNHLDEAGKAGVEVLLKTPVPEKDPATGKAPPVSDEVKKARGDLLAALNGILMTQHLYGGEQASQVKMRAETSELIAENLTGADAVRTNRAVLEDAFPALIKPMPVVEWVVKPEEGGAAIASVGVGRGTLFTDRDFGSYRIIFDVRHLESTGKDHQPCVLVFCMRPAAGEKFLDALGGVQFQVPNGGHWDYRPGFNKGNDVNFKNVLKPKFNNHQWARCEILVNAEKGTARMAVASPIGTKAVELLDFDDVKAGRSGPFGLQMHNDGLLDEYRNIEVEENPTDWELVTTK